MYCFGRCRLQLFTFTCFAGIFFVLCVFTITSRFRENEEKREKEKIANAVKPVPVERDLPGALPGGLSQKKEEPATCLPLHFLPKAENRPLTALVSYPGSGNTWLRHLIQQATGVHTGSQYVDKRLLDKGFPGEAFNDTSVAVVKTHEWRPSTRNLFKKAVLLIRHPKPALQSFFNLWGGGHTGYAPRTSYILGRGKHWQKYFNEQIVEWRSLNMAWLQNFTGPLHIVLYDQLLQDLGPTLRSLVQFLDLPLDEAALQCALDRPEGLHHRQPRKDSFDPFTDRMKQVIRDTERVVFSQLEKYLGERSASSNVALYQYLGTHRLVENDE